MKKIVVLPIMVLAAGLLAGCNSRPASDYFVDISNPEYEKYFEVPDNLERLSSSAINYVVDIAKGNIVNVNKFTFKTLNGIGYKGNSPRLPRQGGFEDLSKHFSDDSIARNKSNNQITSSTTMIKGAGRSDVSESEVSFEWFKNGYVEYNSTSSDSALIDNAVQEISTLTEKETYWYADNEGDDKDMFPSVGYAAYKGNISGIKDPVEHQNIYDKSNVKLTAEDTRAGFLSTLNKYLSLDSYKKQDDTEVAVADDNNIYLTIIARRGGTESDYSDSVVSNYLSYIENYFGEYGYTLAKFIRDMCSDERGYAISFVINPLNPLPSTGFAEFGLDYKAFFAHFLPITHVNTTVIHATKGKDNSWYYDYSAYKDSTILLKNEYNIELAKPVSFEVDYQLSFMDYSEAKEHEIMEYNPKLDKFNMVIQTEMRGVEFTGEDSYEIDPNFAYRAVSNTNTVENRWHNFKYSDYVSGEDDPVANYFMLADYSQYYWQVYPELQTKKVHVFKGEINTQGFLNGSSDSVYASNDRYKNEKYSEFEIKFKNAEESMNRCVEQIKIANAVMARLIKQYNDDPKNPTFRGWTDEDKNNFIKLRDEVIPEATNLMTELRLEIESVSKEKEKIDNQPYYDDAFAFSFRILQDGSDGKPDPEKTTLVGYNDLQNALAVKGNELIRATEGTDSEWKDCPRIIDVDGYYTQYINLTLYVTEDGEIYSEGGNYGLVVDLVQSTNGGLPRPKEEILVVDDPSMPFIRKG